MATQSQYIDRATSGAEPLGGQENGLDFKSILKALRRRRALVITIVLSITVVSALVSLSLPPRYEAVASVLIEQRKSNLIETDSVVEEITDSSALAAEVNLLRSRTYAQKVVEELELLSDPRFNPTLQADAGPWSTLGERLETATSWLPNSWLVAAGFADQPGEPSEGVQEPASAPEDVPVTLPPRGTDAYEGLMHSAVGTLLSGLRIRPGGRDMLLIEVTSSDPRQAAQIADSVAEIYISDQLEIKREAIDEAIAWLKERVAELRKRVLESEGAVVEYQEKHGLIGSGRGEQTGVGQGLAGIGTERAKKEELLQWVRGLRERGAEVDTIAAVLELPVLTELRQRELELQQQEGMLRQKYGARHREIIQLERGTHPIDLERQYLGERIDGELQMAIRRLEGEVAFARQREQDLQRQIEASTDDAGPQGPIEVQLRDLERQAEADRSLYVAFLARFKEVSEQRNLLEPGAQVASRAGIPGEPEFPKPKLMTAAGFTVSLALAGLLAFLVEYFDSGMRTGRQVERVLGLPNLGFVPGVTGLPRQQRLHRHLIENPRSAFAEAVRTVQIATTDAGEADQTTPVVLVTSSLPGEGKTTMALGLAASAACSGRKAVVVELDLRRPRLHDETGMAPDAGLVELLAGEKALDDVLRTSREHPNLDILPAKRLPESPADLLRSPGMAVLLSELRVRYHYVVLDSPPLLGVVDAKLAARLADLVLFVVRWEKTKEAPARAGLENLVDRHTPPIGVVLSQVDIRKHARRGYGEAVQYHRKYEVYYNG